MNSRVSATPERCATQSVPGTSRLSQKDCVAVCKYSEAPIQANQFQGGVFLERYPREGFRYLEKGTLKCAGAGTTDVEMARSGERPFIIYTDASGVGVGAVLAQSDDGLLHPLHFASKPLSRAGRNYNITDQEALAVIYALRKLRVRSANSNPY